jgi:transposase
MQNLSQTLEQVFGTHASALKEVEKQVFSTDTKVVKEVETSHNRSLIAEANACPVVPRFPQNTSLKRKVQSAKAQHRRRTIHEQVWSLRSQGLSGQAIVRSDRPPFCCFEFTPTKMLAPTVVATE